MGDSRRYTARDFKPGSPELAVYLKALVLDAQLMEMLAQAYPHHEGT